MRFTESKKGPIDYAGEQCCEMNAFVMPVCPRCSTSNPSTAITCPNCNLELKAHGHPGIDLHRATGAAPLCSTCAYEADDSCTFDKRPHAMSCTLYQSVDAQPELKPEEIYHIPWQRKNAVRLVLFVLIIFSLIVISI
ncbi:MAG: zinc ribbon domain-containing protein [Phormidesmis sp.]